MSTRQALKVDGPRARSWSFVIGPPKAGTTWVHAYLTSHPGAITPSVKETFFFDRHYHRGWEWYSRQFSDAAWGNGAARFIEVCHDYLFSHSALRRLSRDTTPTAAIVVMRDPVERAISAYLFHRRNGYSGSLREALDVYPDIIDHSRYSKWIPAARRILGSDVIRLVDFALLQRDEALFARSLCEYLELDYFEPNIQNSRRLQASAPRNAAVARAVKFAAVTLRQLRCEWFVRRLKLMPTLQRVLYRPLAKSEQAKLVSSADREYLMSVLAEDLEWYGSHTAVRGGL